GGGGRAGQRGEGRGGVQVVKAGDDVQNPALTLRLPVPASPPGAGFPPAPFFFARHAAPCGAHPCDFLPDLPMPCPSPLSGQVSLKEVPISSAQLARHRPQTRNQNNSGFVPRTCPSVWWQADCAKAGDPLHCYAKENSP